MRASFLLVVAVAVLVGLGVAVAVKQLGLLAGPPPVETVVQPVTVVTVPPPPQIAVASRHLFQGDTIRAGDVRLRSVRPEEYKDYTDHPTEYMPAVLEGIYYRIPNALIEADQPIRRKHLQEVAKPETLPSRIAPGMRAVNLSLTKNYSVGGLLGVGDWVDVYVSIDVGRTDNPYRFPLTGLVVPAAQIVAKRNTLWTVFAALPTEEVEYTLAMNPYRAGLLEYAKSVGTVSFAPLSDGEKKKLDARKQEALADPEKATGLLTLDDPMSPANRDERLRVQEMTKGTAAIGPEDLRVVLNLPPIPVPEPVRVAEYVEVISNGQRQTLTFPTAERGVVVPPKPDYLFFPPGNGKNGKPPVPPNNALVPRQGL